MRSSTACDGDGGPSGSPTPPAATAPSPHRSAPDSTRARATSETAPAHPEPPGSPATGDLPTTPDQTRVGALRVHHLTVVTGEVTAHMPDIYIPVRQPGQLACRQAA